MSPACNKCKVTYGSLYDTLPPTQNIHVLILVTWEYVPFNGMGDSADMMKLRNLRWGDYPGVSGWAQCKWKGFYKKKAEGSELEREDLRTETEVKGQRRYHVHDFEGREGTCTKECSL